MSSPKSVVREPDRAVGVVGATPLAAQLGQRGLDRAGLDERAFAEPGVELHAHRRKGVAQVALDSLVAPLGRVDAVGHLGRPLLDVLAGSRPRDGGPPSGRERATPNSSHLHAVVVEVVLAVHDVAAALEDVAQRVAVRRPASAAGMQRAGGVGRDELDVHPRSPAPTSKRA